MTLQSLEYGDHFARDIQVITWKVNFCVLIQLSLNMDQSYKLSKSENEPMSQPMLSTICDAATGVKELSEFILDELFGHTILDIDIRIGRELCEWWRTNHVKYNQMLYSNINLDTVMSICDSGNTTKRSFTTICNGILRENMIRKIEKKCN